MFCKIAQKKVSSDIVYEDDKFVVFLDINPQAPLHLLIIPRKHIHSIDHIQVEDKELMGDLILTAKKIARQYNLAGYKLRFNVGKEGGQVIDHIHLHLLADKTS